MKTPRSSEDFPAPCVDPEIQYANHMFYNAFSRFSYQLLARSEGKNALDRRLPPQFPNSHRGRVAIGLCISLVIFLNIVVAIGLPFFAPGWFDGWWSRLPLSTVGLLLLTYLSSSVLYAVLAWFGRRDHNNGS